MYINICIHKSLGIYMYTYICGTVVCLGSLVSCKLLAMHMYIVIYICMYAYVYIYVCVCIHMYVCICIYMCVCVCVHIYMGIYVRTYMYAWSASFPQGCLS